MPLFCHHQLQLPLIPLLLPSLLNPITGLISNKSSPYKPNNNNNSSNNNSNSKCSGLCCSSNSKILLLLHNRHLLHILITLEGL